MNDERELIESGMTPGEAKVLRMDERARRLRLAWSMTLAVGGVALLGFAVMLVGLIGRVVSTGGLPASSDPVWAIMAVISVIIVLCGGAYYAARREWVNLAATGVLLAVTVGAVGYLYVTNHGRVLGPQTLLGLLALLGVLVAVGYLGNSAAVIATTLGLNVIAWLTLALGIPFPASGAAFAAAYHVPLAGGTFVVLDQATALACIPAVILLQWGVAALVLAGSDAQRPTRRELRAARVGALRARRLADLKDQFIITGNAELRAPLQQMQSYLNSLHSQGNTLTPVQRAELVAQASDIGQRIARHVAAMPDITTIEQAATDFAPMLVPVRPAVLAAAALAEPATDGATPREVRLAVPADLAIWGDEARLQQILTNLIANAAKYAPPETPIEISALPIEDLRPLPGQRRKQSAPEPQIEITVRDYGPGIPPDQASLLFQRFARLPRELASPVSGNGLGLYLCRVYAEAMGGRIWIESTGNEGEGTIIHLRLPVPPHRQGSTHRPAGE
jgi:signal transduction histidine kinase